MNKQDAKRKLPIITAFAEGKTVQIRDGYNWKDLENASFTSDFDQYRIKPEPKTVPLTIEDLYEHFKKGTIFKNKESFTFKIEGINATKLWLCGICVTLSEFLRCYIFEDGLPLTKVIEE